MHLQAHMSATNTAEHTIVLYNTPMHPACTLSCFADMKMLLPIQDTAYRVTYFHLHIIEAIKQQLGVELIKPRLI